MNLNDVIAQIQSELEKLANQEKINQQEQEATNQQIKQLETQIKEQYRRQSKLDDEAINIYSRGEELRTKLEKVKRIAALGQELQELYHECQDNQELLDTLYSSISLLAEGKSIEFDHNAVLNGDRNGRDDYLPKEENPNSDYLFGQTTASQSNQEKTQKNNEKEEKIAKLTLYNIKTALPNAELIYKQLVACNLEKYQAYQNFIIDELDVIWCSVAFIAFGRAAYHELSFKHHPDLHGSEQAMQLINTAWEMSEEYLADITDMAQN